MQTARTIFACVLGLAGCLSLPAQDLRVTSSGLLIAGAGRVTWGAKNNLLAFDSLNANGYYDVYTSNPDGSSVTCLTCGASLPPYNKGNPEWHPSNQYLAIEVQWGSALVQADAAPGVGVNNDLYIMNAAGTQYWPVTSQAAGVLHPRFSPDGTKILWVQRTSQTFSNYWNLMLGNFSVAQDGTPQVTNIVSLPPCQNNVFCETGGFSVDGETVFFTGTLDGQSETGLDIYSYNLQTGALANLTNSPSNWDEFPTSFPNANKLVWMSGVAIVGVGLETDYWTMDYDGTNKVQLTFFNNEYAPSWYLNAPISCAKFNWSPDGTQMASYLIPNGISLAKTGSVYLLGLEAAAPTLSAATFARPPLAADSIAATFYSNLSEETAPAVSTPLPSTLAGSTVSVTDAMGVTRSAPLFFVSPGQINWEVPAGSAAGPATIQFTNSQNVSVRDTVDVEAVSPGIFTASAAGSGPPAGYVLIYPEGQSSPSSTQTLSSCSADAGCSAVPVSLGSSTDSAFLVLFGTGLRHATSPVTAQIGGTVLGAAYSGAQGVFAGLDQINLALPRSLIGSGLLNLTLTADGVTSNTVQIDLQ